MKTNSIPEILKKRKEREMKDNFLLYTKKEIKLLFMYIRMYVLFCYVRTENKTFTHCMREEQASER